MKDLIHILFAGAMGALAAYFNVLAVPLVAQAPRRQFVSSSTEPV